MPLSEADYINALLDSPRCKPVNREEEYALFQRYRMGDRRAGDRIIEANLRFVRQVAFGFRNRGLTFGELMNEGGLGLRKALPRHDPERTVDGKRIKFISYAVWWVRQSMVVAIAEQGHALKIPPNFVEKQQKVDRARRKIEQRHSRPATLEEMAEAAGMAPDRILQVSGALGTAASLNSATVDGGETEAIELLHGDEVTGQDFEDGRFRSDVARLMDSLDPIDREILFRYFGFRGGEAETLDEIGKTMEITRERVRQRKEKALDRLKRPAEKTDLYTPSKKEKS